MKSVANDFAAHIDRLRQLSQHGDEMVRTLFDSQKPIYVARAPGRLDVMGGIGDYSGSLVLELPIAVAAFAAVQGPEAAGVTIVSLPAGSNTEPVVTTIAASDWTTLQESDLDAARQFFARERLTSWAAYIAGPILVLLREKQLRFAGGLRVLIDSQVPPGAGVSSSAAVEVATMRAAAALFGVDLPAEELARMCQLAENRVVGAPCGVMDQMTSALGRENELLALRCQPATIEGFVPVPPELTFWGIDSGIRHEVSGSDYSSVRCAAFMGYRIIAAAAGLEAKPASDAPHVFVVDDPKWNGYLANITSPEFEAEFAPAIPERMSGADFIERYGGTTDHVTRVDPARIYNIRAAVLHPIEENERANRFRTLLKRPIDDRALHELGQLMAAAHASYTACGLASAATDLLVKLVHDAGPTAGLYGAKITGGGSGGAVAILGRRGADQAIENVAGQYTKLTGRQTHIFRGSSPGAYGTPVQEVVI